MGLWVGQYKPKTMKGLDMEAFCSQKEVGLDATYHSSSRVDAPNPCAIAQRSIRHRLFFVDDVQLLTMQPTCLLERLTNLLSIRLQYLAIFLENLPLEIVRRIQDLHLGL
jgi:hypothetical protein